MSTNTNNTIAEIRNAMKKAGYRTNKVAVEIYGKLMYMTETEIRALQVVARDKANESEAAFNEFCSNVIVYSSRSKRKAKHTMIFRKDGKFSNEFETGFYDVNSNLAFEIL